VSGQTFDLSPETSSLSVNPSALSPLCLSDTGILTGKAGGDDITRDAIEAFNICKSGYIGPPMGENLSAKDVDLAERDGSHSGPLKAEGEAANSREQIEDIHVHLQ
jgi:hypothetical protein